MSYSANLYDVILGQYVTEKSATASEKFNQYTFKVARSSDKTIIKRAINKSMVLTLIFVELLTDSER